MLFPFQKIIIFIFFDILFSFLINNNLKLYLFKFTTPFSNQIHFL